MPVIVATAISAGAQATSSMINNTVNNLFDEKVRRGEVNLLNAKAEREKMLSRLASLDSQQKYELAKALQNSQNINEQFKILQDTSSKIAVQGVENIGDIYEAAVNAQSKNTMTTAIIIGVSLIALLGTLFFITKMEK
jgi:polyhydroxyalkanoate synthesis regulator phasin